MIGFNNFISVIISSTRCITSSICHMYYLMITKYKHIKSHFLYSAQVFFILYRSSSYSTVALYFSLLLLPTILLYLPFRFLITHDVHIFKFLYRYLHLKRMCFIIIVLKNPDIRPIGQTMPSTYFSYNLHSH